MNWETHHTKDVNFLYTGIIEFLSKTQQDFCTCRQHYSEIYIKGQRNHNS